MCCRTSCHDIRNGIGRCTDTRPARCAQYDDRDAPRGQILLILQVLVGGDHHFESGVIGCLQQCSVSERRPSALVGSLYSMQQQSTAERRRGALIEQDTHLRGAHTTTSRVLQDRSRFPLDARWRGVTGAGAVAEMDLWVDVEGPTVSSVSGREVTALRRYVLGTLRGESLRVVTLAAGSSADTVSVLTARLAGDSLVGSYDSPFATTGARVLRRIAR